MDGSGWHCVSGLHCELSTMLACDQALYSRMEQRESGKKEIRREWMGEREGERERMGDAPIPTPFSPLGHFIPIQFLLGPSSHSQTLPAKACSQAGTMFVFLIVIIIVCFLGTTYAGDLRENTRIRDLQAWYERAG